jgi:drug/metabolite transporter (DMT)-like permease
VILHVAFLGIFCSALGYYFYAIAMERLGPGKSGVFLNLIPVVTVAAGFALGEKLSVTELAGGAVVVGGVFLATWTGLRNRNSVKNIQK